MLVTDKKRFFEICFKLIKIVEQNKFHVLVFAKELDLVHLNEHSKCVTDLYNAKLISLEIFSTK